MRYTRLRHGLLSWILIFKNGEISLCNLIIHKTLLDNLYKDNYYFDNVCYCLKN